MLRPSLLLLLLALAGAPLLAAQTVGGKAPGSGSTPPSGDSPTGQHTGKQRGSSAGGTWKGPGDTVPPVVPGDPTGPGSPGAPPTGPQPPPSGPGGSPPSPSQPPSSDLPLSEPPQQPSPTQPPATSSWLLGDDLTDWTWWWEINKEPYLVVPERMESTRPTTGSAEDLLGQRLGSPAGGVRPSDAVLFGQVVPVLLRTLNQDEPDSLLGASAIALARIGASRPAQGKAAYAAVLQERLEGASQQLTESLLLALGILGNESSAPYLTDVLLSTREGREALHTSSITTRTRAFAAYALGLIGNATPSEDVRRYVVHQLVWCLETDRSASVDLDVACINALGVVPIGDAPAPPSSRRDAAPPGSSLTAQVDYLLAILGQQRSDNRVRAQVPIALGRMLQSSVGPRHEALRTAVLEELVDRIAAHRREPREVVQSCVIALGQLADADADDVDQRARRVLIRIPDLVNDLAARQLALIALGRACGRSGAGEPSPLREERAHLLAELGRGSALLRPWAALALGVGERGGAPADDVGRALRASLDDARADTEVRAFALGLGLSRADQSAALLLAGIEDRGDQATRGTLALSIGLAGDRSGRFPLLELLPGTAYQPQLLHDAALGLALLGAGDVVPVLVRMLEESGSLASQASVSMGLARSRDERAVAPLLDLYADASETTAARRIAAAALGAVGDRRPLPWKAIYAVDANLHAAPESLFTPAGGGVLNHPW
jgi:hypothetical protein